MEAHFHLVCGEDFCLSDVCLKSEVPCLYVCLSKNDPMLPSCVGIRGPEIETGDTHCEVIAVRGIPRDLTSSGHMHIRLDTIETEIPMVTRINLFNQRLIQSTPLNRVTSVRGHFGPIKRRTLLTETILY